MAQKKTPSAAKKTAVKKPNAKDVEILQLKEEIKRQASIIDRNEYKIDWLRKVIDCQDGVISGQRKLVDGLYKIFNKYRA